MPALSPAKPSVRRSWSGRAVLITGSAGGLGLAMARQFAARGARVWISDVDASAVRRATDALMAEGLSVTGTVLDVRDEARFAQVLEVVVAAHGRLDVLVNNAAVDLTAEVADLSLERWRSVLDVNLSGVIHGTHHAYRHMVAQREGLIVNVASGAGLLGFPTSVPYTTSKAAIVGLSRALRAEAEVYGVRVALVFPGIMRTPIQHREGIGVDRPAFLARLPSRPIDVDDSARIIVDRLARGRLEITTQWANRLGAWVLGALPWVGAGVRRRIVRDFHALKRDPD